MTPQILGLGSLGKVTLPLTSELHFGSEFPSMCPQTPKPGSQHYCPHNPTLAISPTIGNLSPLVGAETSLEIYPPSIVDYEINMSTPHGQGDGGPPSKPPTRVAPTNTVGFSTASPMQKAHVATIIDAVTVGHQAQRPSINRHAAGPVPNVRAARPNMPSSVEEDQPPSAPSAPSAIRKRGRGSVADPGAQLGGERAAKRPANASTRPDSAFGDAWVAKVGMSFDNMDEGATSSAAERMESMSPGEVEPDSAGMSMEPAYVKRERPSADVMRPSTSENYKSATSTRAPVKDGQWGSARSDSMDRSAHGGYQPTQGFSRPGAPLVKCGACRSKKHKTKECPVPSSDGTVVICPFHNCTVLDKSTAPCHPLDGLTKYNPGDSDKTPLYCGQLMRYEMAVESNYTAKIRHLLPEIFKELVLNRRRKPSCRVVNKEVCFINIAIEYSLEFCHGKMPSDLQGMWPYTMRDATDPAIFAKLRRYDKLGWKGMPPGELEAKSWEQIKREYAQGIIPPQIHSKYRPYYQVSTPTPTTAELGDTETHQHAMDADADPQADHEHDDGQGSPLQEVAFESQDLIKKDVIIQMLGVLNGTVNTNSEQLAALSEQVAADSAAKAEQMTVLSERLATLSEQVADLSTRGENSDALSPIREEIAAVSKKIDAISDNKKDFLRKIVDSLP